VEGLVMRHFRFVLVPLAVLFSLSVPAKGHAEEILVAAASNLTFMMQEVIDGFEAQSPHRVRLSLGSSGNFYTQIQNGAPFDVYLSADVDYPRRLGGTDLVEPGSFFAYASGRIVVWVRRQSQIDVERLGMRALTETKGRIAIANPRHAPYGRAAEAALEFYGLRDVVEARLVYGENVSQAAGFLQSGAAEVGLIALSLASSEAMREAGRFWIVPENTHAELIHAGVILANARRQGRLDAARAFVDWLRSEVTGRVLGRYGFSSPNE
jgi:molybdate transport system substrate-binding protein